MTSVNIYFIVPLENMPRDLEGKYLLHRDCSDIYVGRTTISIRRRFSYHKGNYKAWKSGKSPKFCSSFDLFDKYGVNGLGVVLMEAVSKEIGREREHYWIKELNTVNRNKLEFDLVEYHRNYYKKHREDIRESTRQYYAANKEKLLITAKEYRERNADKIREFQKKDYLKNREKRLEVARIKYAAKKDCKRAVEDEPPEEDWSQYAFCA